MSQKNLSGILTLLVPQVIGEIVKQNNVSEAQATQDLYLSQTYRALEEEETKLWHLSPKALCELYLHEKRTGVLEFPEEA